MPPPCLEISWMIFIWKWHAPLLVCWLPCFRYWTLDIWAEAWRSSFHSRWMSSSSEKFEGVADLYLRDNPAQFYSCFGVGSNIFFFFKRRCGIKYHRSDWWNHVHLCSLASKLRWTLFPLKMLASVSSWLGSLDDFLLPTELMKIN